METEEVSSQVLEYLKKHKEVNTFRLARELGIDRHKILNIIKNLEEKGSVHIKSGKVVFLKFPSKEKKIIKEIKAKETSSVPRRKAKPKFSSILQMENKELKEKLLKIEASIKRQHYTRAKKYNEQSEYIQQLEKRIDVLKQKADASPKIITKTIIKKIKVPIKVKEKETKKFKLPKLNIAWLKNIQEFKKPNFIEQKISAEKPKINFAGLNKSIQQLNVPEILRNPKSG